MNWYRFANTLLPDVKTFLSQKFIDHGVKMGKDAAQLQAILDSVPNDVELEELVVGSGAVRQSEVDFQKQFNEPDAPGGAKFDSWESDTPSTLPQSALPKQYVAPTPPASQAVPNLRDKWLKQKKRKDLDGKGMSWFAATHNLNGTILT